MNKIIAALVSLVLISTPALAWNVNINAGVNDATAMILGAGGDGNAGFSYAVGATGGIVNGDGNIYLGGGGYELGGGMGVSISGSGASGDWIFATHDLTVNGCCEGCPCPSEYEYGASSDVDVINGEGVEIELNGGAGESGAGQKLKAEADFAGSFDTSMSSSLTVGEDSTTHLMGAYGENVWFKSFGKQGFGSEDCGVHGFFVSVMGYHDSLCDGVTC